MHEGLKLCEEMMPHVPDRRSSRRRTLRSSEERTRFPSPNSGENRSSKATVGTSKAEAATAHKYAHVAATSKPVRVTLAFAAMAGRTAELLRC